MKPFDIPEPCRQGWQSMRRDVGARHCASCNEHVVDVSRLTPTELGGLVLLTRGRFCAHQTIRGGELVLASDPASSAPRRSPFALRMVVGGAAVASAFGVAACGPASATPPDPIVVSQVDPDRPVSPDSPEPRVNDVRADEGEVDGLIRPPDDVTDQHVAFAIKSARLDGQAAAMVARAARLMQVSPWIAAVVVEGHFASDELRADGPALGRARADAVVAEMVRLGVAPGRLRAVALPGGKLADDPLSHSVTFRICTSLDDCK